MTALIVALSANAANWYISGAFQGWSHCNPNYKFTETSSGVFTINLGADLSGEFLICQGTDNTPDWNNKIGGVTKMKADVEYTYVPGGNNFSTDGIISNAVITFNTNTKKIKITGQDKANDYDTVYLVGDINGSGWNENTTSYPMTLKAGTTNTWVGTYPFSSDNNYFKMKAGTYVYGTGGDDINVTIGQNYTASQSGNAFVLGPGEFTFTFVLEKNADTGVLSVEGSTVNPWNKVYFDNTNTQWETVWAFVDDDMDPFPGNEMTPTSEPNIWVYDVPGEYETIMFSEGTSANVTSTYTVQNNYIYSTTNNGSPYTPSLAIYVRGAFNSWGTGDANLMKSNGDGTYSITYTTFKAGEFKFGTEDWSQSWGGDQTGTNAGGEGICDVTTGKSYNAWSNAGVNYYLPQTLTNVTITLSAPNNGNGTMTITGTIGDTPEFVDLYLVGANYGNWGADPEYLFTYQGNNTYTLHVNTLDGEFKVYNGDWNDINLGADAGGADVATVPAVIGANTLYQNSSVNLVADNLQDVNLTLNYVVNANSATLTIQDQSGVENVIIDSNAPAEYFNLQGVRVDNPTSGLYIVRQGGKVSKQIVR